MSARRRLLFLLPFPPHPAGDHGGARAAGQLLDRLGERHDVGVLYLRSVRDQPIAESLRRRVTFAEEMARPELDATTPQRVLRACRRAAGLLRGRPVWAQDWRVPAFAARAADIVRDWRPDVVQAEMHVMGQYFERVRDGARTATVLVEFEPGARAAADLVGATPGIQRIFRQLDAAAWRRYERNVLLRSDGVVALTEVDRTALLELAPDARIVRIGLGVLLPLEPLDPIGAPPPRILYAGNFVHPPNVDAAIRLARDIFPAVRTRRPDAALEIVGNAPPPTVRQLEMPGIAVLGRVEDMTPYLDRAAVVAGPIRIGGGIRVKMMDAFAAGKAVVATQRALAGLEVVNGEHALVAETDAEFADALVSLLDEPDRRAGIGRAARAWAASHLSWSEVVTKYESLYDGLLTDAHGRHAAATR